MEAEVYMKIAIWGAGKMGQVHGNAYKKMGNDVEISYVIEHDADKAEEFAHQFHCKALTDIRSLEKDHVDAIDICLPTWLHREAIEQAAGICRGIFCEKPVCLNQREYNELKCLAKEKDCFVMIGQVIRFWSGYVKARELLLNGDIGKPRMITCKRRQKMPAWSKGNWLMDSRLSGGILMDLCVHDVDYVYWILGLPERVACEIVKRGDTTLHSFLTLTYEDCCASINGSWGMPEGFHEGQLEAELEIVGDRGMLIYKSGNELELIADSGSTMIPLPKEDGYEKELRYFVQCVRENTYPAQSDICSVEGTMEILWAAGRAYGSKQIVKPEMRYGASECMRAGD